LVRPPPKSLKPQPIDARRLNPTTASVGGKGRSGTPLSSRLPMTHVARTTAQLAAAVLLAFTWLLGPSLAAGMTLPPSQPGVYVYDFAGIWSPDTEARAQAVAEAIRTRTEAQMVAVSIPSGLSRVDPDIAIADARTILDAWGVGRRGVNDGLVVLFDMDTSKAHGQVAMFAGSGFEDAYLTASERERIITGDMLPRAV